MLAVDLASPVHVLLQVLWSEICSFPLLASLLPFLWIPSPLSALGHRGVSILAINSTAVPVSNTIELHQQIGGTGDDRGGNSIRCEPI